MLKLELDLYFIVLNNCTQFGKKNLQSVLKLSSGNHRGTDGRMDRKTDGRADGRTDGRTHTQNTKRRVSHNTSPLRVEGCKDYGNQDTALSLSFLINSFYFLYYGWGGGHLFMPNYGDALALKI